MLITIPLLLAPVYRAIFYCQRNIAGVYPKTTPSSLLPGFLFSTSPSLATQTCLLFLNLLTNKKIIPFALLLLLLLLITINCYCVLLFYILWQFHIILLARCIPAYHTETSLLGLSMSWEGEDSRMQSSGLASRSFSSDNLRLLQNLTTDWIHLSSRLRKMLLLNT